MGEEVKKKELEMEKMEKLENGGVSPSPAVKYYGWKAMPYIIGSLSLSALCSVLVLLFFLLSFWYLVPVFLISSRIFVSFASFLSIRSSTMRHPYRFLHLIDAIRSIRWLRPTISSFSISETEDLSLGNHFRYLR